MSEIAISPRFVSTDAQGATLDRQIDIFEDQVQGWLLDQAKVLAAAGQNAGFSILTLLLTYVEGIACFLEGMTSKNQSGRFFQIGLEAIFPELTTQTAQAFHDEFYAQVRCGLLHEAMTRGKVQITRGASHAIRATLDASGTPALIVLEPWRFLESVEAHFRAYTARLRDPAEGDLRRKFETWFNARAA